MSLANIPLYERCGKKTPKSDAESQRRRGRHLTVDNRGPWNRRIKRRLSLSGVPNIPRHRDVSQLSEILQRSNFHIGNAIHQMLNAAETESSFQILNIALDGCEQKITTVARMRNGGIRKRDGFVVEYGRGEKKSHRYEFCRKVRGATCLYG